MTLTVKRVLSLLLNMADEDVNTSSENINLDPQYQDVIDQCDSLRRSNLQLREEILRLERENAEFKKQSLIEKNSKYENISGPTSIHVSSIDNDSEDPKESNNNYPTELVENLRAEILQLKTWKVKATQEIVDRDRALADLESELVKQQRDFDTNSQECMGHQRVIQELKSQIDQVFITQPFMFLKSTTFFTLYRSVLEEKGHQVICQKADPFQVIATICTHLPPVFLHNPHHSLMRLCPERANFKAVLPDV